MKLMSKEEQKQELLSILKYIDKVCRKNNIKYTLIGGSLIGAIRNKGMIPWDDDIDIALLNEDYYKLINILKVETNEYKLFFNEQGYYYPYAKLTSKRTILKENNLKPINNMGIFVDIFRYDKVPNCKLLQDIHWKKIMFKKGLIHSLFYEKGFGNNFLKKIRSNIAYAFGQNKVINIYNKECTKYNEKKTNFIMTNWVAYGKRNEIQDINDFNEYIDTEFENMKVMIIKNYDNVLSKTFGEYMKLPPKEKRKSHNLTVYYKEKGE